MSELKVYLWPFSEDGKNGLSEFYKKSDVDAKLEELKQELRQSRASGERWFKRCMEARSEMFRAIRSLFRVRFGLAKAQYLFYDRWINAPHDADYWRDKMRVFKSKIKEYTP